MTNFDESSRPTPSIPPVYPGSNTPATAPTNTPDPRPDYRPVQDEMEDKTPTGPTLDERLDGITQAIRTGDTSSAWAQLLETLREHL